MRGFWVHGLLVVVGAVALGAFDRPITGDNQHYFFLAERAASGVPPHVSHVDPKTQLSTLVGAGAIRLSRAAGGDDVAAVRVACIAATAVAVVGAAALAAELGGLAVAGHVAALAYVTSRGVLSHAAIGCQPKLFLACFAILAHLATIRRRDLASGLLAGAAFLCWQPGLVVVAAIAAEICLRGGQVARRLLRLAAGFVAVVVVYQAYFVASGAFAIQLEQTLLAQGGSLHVPRRFLASLWFVLREAVPGETIPHLVPIVFFAWLGASAAWALAGPRRALERLRATPGLLSFWLAVTGALVFTLYDHQGLPDLFFPGPYFAVATGMAARSLLERLPEPEEPPGASFRLVVVAAIVLALQLLRSEAAKPRPDFTLGEQRQLAEVLRSYDRRFGPVWAYGATHLLGLAHMDNYVPYGLFYDDLEASMDLSTYRPLRDGRLPTWIVRSEEELPAAATLLPSHYEEIRSLVFARQGLRLYRLREAPRVGDGGSP